MLAFRAADDDTPGFRYGLDGGLVHRQLLVSVLVVVMLAVAIVGAALSLDLRPVGSRIFAVSVPAVNMRQAADHWMFDPSRS